MTALTEPHLRIHVVDAALAAWRQGDCVLGDQWFAHRVDRAFAVTDAGRLAVEAGVDLADQEVAGFVVVTQTCDVVRSSADRPFIEVCPLIEVDDHRLREVQRGRRPAYAYVPLLSGRKLVADRSRSSVGRCGPMKNRPIARNPS